MINKRNIPYFDLLPVIIISLILYKAINNIEHLTSWVSHLLSLINYFIWGFAIAYLLNPFMVYLERRFKLKRGLSIIITYLLFLGIIVLAVTLITPRIVKNIADLLSNLPNFIVNTEDWINKLVIKYQVYDKYGVSSYIENNISTIINHLNDILKSVLNLLFSNLINFTSTLIKLVSGIVISVYLLKDKEAITAGIKKLIYSILSVQNAEGLFHLGSQVNDVFSQYVIGKLIDSLIIGIISFMGLSILHIPYALLISLIIGITNMIPYFGNVIGLVPACIITLFSSSFKTLELILFIAVLSQIDGWFISPRIVGKKIGLSPLLIILAIALGGGLFGFWGMFLGVPIMAVVKVLAEGYMDKRLRNKNIEALK